MRTYAPASTEAVLERLLEEPSLARGVIHHEVLPARDAEFAPFPDWVDPRIRAGLASRGISELYTHQAAAIDAVHAGQDVVVVTPTASGKTLCYAVPVLQAITEDAASRALFLFPTKALGQDQVAELTELTKAAGLEVAATYDGDTPAPIRSAIRTAGRVVVTNRTCSTRRSCPTTQVVPAVRAAEGHRRRRAPHVPRVFGSHVANVLRRLLRICAHYGSRPVIVCCSATIGNPQELAELLTGRGMRLVDRNGHRPANATCCSSTLLLDPSTGARGSA